VRTWLRPPQGSFLLRDYEIFLNDKKIGECTSTFSVMDMQTRKPATMDFGSYGAVFREEGLLAHHPEKIALANEVQDLTQFEVRNSDIDLNNHVNNTRYAQWILDSIPLEILRAGAELKSYEVNFLAETKSGDVVKVQRGMHDAQNGNESVIHFQGLRVADSKPVFTALLHVLA
jgi:acyl-ACP thioesterase